MSSGGPGAVAAGVADGQENGLPAAGGVAPVVGLQDERALGAVGDHEAVDDVVELAAITAALVDVAHQFSRLAAVRGVLGGGREGMFFYCLTFYLDLSKPCARTCNKHMADMVLFVPFVRLILILYACFSIRVSLSLCTF